MFHTKQNNMHRQPALHIYIATCERRIIMIKNIYTQLTKSLKSVGIQSREETLSYTSHHFASAPTQGQANEDVAHRSAHPNAQYFLSSYHALSHTL